MATYLNFPRTWTDGPVVEDTPMQNSYFGDPVFTIDVTYTPGHFEDEVSGTIVIELFPQWAPVTVGNMIEHIEDGLYDGIFFQHNVGVVALVRPSHWSTTKT